jgi:hypothetical protein
MPAHFPVPIQEDFRDLLMDLIGRGVAVRKVDRLEIEDSDAGVFAEYITADGVVGAVLIVDSSFAVRAGAALSMIPPRAAEESLTPGAQLPRHLIDNLREIANIFARLLNGPTTPHLRLHAMHPHPGPIPDLVMKVVFAPEVRRDFACAVEGYGEGRFALLVG